MTGPLQRARPAASTIARRDATVRLARRRAVLGRGLPALCALALLVAGAVVTDPAAAASKRSCFGAAARDVKHPCTNRTRSVSPKLSDRFRRAASPCDPVKAPFEAVCTFGAPAAAAKRTIALVGDSHALHWRGALDVVADAKRWQGYSLTAPGCFFSAAVDDLPVGLREPCRPWYRAVQRWLARHPRISTVFVSQSAPTPVVVPRGRTYGQVKISGFRRAWRALPRTVRQIVVIRDAPRTTSATFACVQRVLKAGRERPGIACARSRSAALRWDTAVSAARGLRSKRYRWIDMTRYFCGSKRCYPVIGGALVHRDSDHITEAYARTLGPFLLRRVRALTAPR